MKLFRKISLFAVAFSLVILATHALVPHHHDSPGGDVICLSHHAKSHSCTEHMQCVDSPRDCEGDRICGLSHTFISNSDHFDITPYCVECHSIVPEPNVKEQINSFIISEAPVIPKCILRNIPLRAPPIA